MVIRTIIIIIFKGSARSKCQSKELSCASVKADGNLKLPLRGLSRRTDTQYASAKLKFPSQSLFIDFFLKQT